MSVLYAIPLAIKRHFITGVFLHFIIGADTIIKVRFIGIDTPESTNKQEELGKEAAIFTTIAIPKGTTVYLEKDVSETDKYDRLLRYVWLEKPESFSNQEAKTKMLNAILLLEGYANASTYPPDVKYSDFFFQCENEAESSSLGLWALSDKTVAPTLIPTPSDTPIPTPVHSENVESAQSVSGPDLTASPVLTNSQYCASSIADKFHHLGCKYADQILPQNVVFYYTRDEAMADGKVPCKLCKP